MFGAHLIKEVKRAILSLNAMIDIRVIPKSENDCAHGLENGEDEAKCGVPPCTTIPKFRRDCYAGS